MIDWFFDRIRCIEVKTDSNGEPTLLLCDAYNENDTTLEKHKGTIQWVAASTAIKVETRLYNHLFIVEEINDDIWETQLNPTSEIVILDSLIDSSILTHYTLNIGSHFQYERIGYFVIDPDSNISTNKLIFNLTVSLKDSKPIETNNNSNNNNEKSKSRKEEQLKQLADKLAKKSINPLDMYKNQLDLYSLFDSEGIPTHDNNNEKLSKSLIKKLKKDWEKQKLLFESP